MAFAAVLALFGAGCRTNWGNHYHSDSNQQLAQSAVDDLKSFTSSSAGFGPALLTNLNAQFGVVQLGDTARLTLEKNSFAIALSDETWNNLRGKLFGRWGAGFSRGDLDAKQKLVTAEIALRIQKVQAVGKILEALAEGQKALIAQAAARVTNATTLLTNSSAAGAKPSTNPPSAGTTNAAAATSTNESLEGLLLAFQNAIVDSGRQYRTNELARQQATVVEKAILNEADASRDPASAYALVAVVGTGLDANSFSNLDLFLGYLSQRLTALQQSQTNQQAGPIWQAFATSLTNAQQLVWAAQQSGSGAQSSFQALFQQGVTNIEAVFTRPSNQLGAIASNLTQATKDSGNVLTELELGVTDLRNLLGSNQFSAFFARTTSLASLAGTFVTNALPFNTNLDSLLKDQKIITPADLQQIGSVLQRIANENQAAAQRLLTFFADLASTRLSLYQENLRHYQALSYVGSQELKRWQTLSDLNAQNTSLYSTAVSKAGAMVPGALFGFDYAGWRTSYTNAWTAHYGPSPPPPDLGPALVPPVIHPDSRILPSIRLLAENARAWQQASPAQTDPAGILTTASNVRLWRGVKLVQAYFLMFSLDGQYASENSRFLRKEIMEHNLQVDGVVDLVDEADFRLHLGDILAFHSSGVTDADIQTAVNIIQAAFVGWIGSKQ